MPRRKVVINKDVTPDAIFNSELITKFINCLMKSGKKSVAEKILYGTIKYIDEKGMNGKETLFKAIENVKPTLEVKSRRVGGATYQVPVEIRPDRRQALAIRWIIDYSRERAGKSMMEKLSAELLDAANNTGASIKKKIDTHKMAEANKAFAHYKW